MSDSNQHVPPACLLHILVSHILLQLLTTDVEPRRGRCWPPDGPGVTAVD